MIVNRCRSCRRNVDKFLLLFPDFLTGTRIEFVVDEDLLLLRFPKDESFFDPLNQGDQLSQSFKWAAKGEEERKR